MVIVMFIKKRKLIAGILVLLLIISLVGCKDSLDNSETSLHNKQDNTKGDTITNDFVIGFYEGTTNQSGQNVLTSLNLKEGDSYEFYISTIGLIDRGKYEMIDENSIKFISQETSSEIMGRYNNGKITSDFAIDGSKSEFIFEQVGSPDDFYKVFLGDYIATNSSDEIIVLSLRENKLFEISSTDINGNFDIINGKLVLLKGNNELLSIGEFDLKEKSITILLNLNNVENQYIFSQNSEENNIVYYGYSTKGMSGSTPVTLIIKPAKRFEIVTSKPRGIGIYEIGKSINGGYEIILTYTDPASRPDGSTFTMTGVINNENINDENTTITIEQIEYQVDMGEGSLSTMNLGRVEFSTKPLEEDSIEKPIEQTKDDKTAPEDTTKPDDKEKPEDTEKPNETGKTEGPKPTEQDNNETKEETIDVVGQYVTTVMGTTEVIMDIKADGSYELGTGETGTYEVSPEGKITFTSNTEGRKPYDTVYDSTTGGFTITFSIINGTPENDYVFIKK